MVFSFVFMKILDIPFFFFFFSPSDVVLRPKPHDPIPNPLSSLSSSILSSPLSPSSKLSPDLQRRSPSLLALRESRALRPDGAKRNGARLDGVKRDGARPDGARPLDGVEYVFEPMGNASQPRQNENYQSNSQNGKIKAKER